jgi:hypothetical protein
VENKNKITAILLLVAMIALTVVTFNALSGIDDPFSPDFSEVDNA